MICRLFLMVRYLMVKNYSIEEKFLFKVNRGALKFQVRSK